MAASNATVAQSSIHTFSNGIPSQTADSLKNGHIEEAFSRVAYPCNGGTIHKAVNWIPIREEVLWNRLEDCELSLSALVSVVRMESNRLLLLGTILTRFHLGITLANKILRTYKLEHIVDHVIYEKNVMSSWYPILSFSTE